MIGRHLNHTIEKAIQSSYTDRVVRSNTHATQNSFTAETQKVAPTMSYNPNTHLTLISQSQQQAPNNILPYTDKIQIVNAT